MVPCKTCLVLAICKNKRNIECEAAYNWIHHAGKTRDERIKILSKLLPHWEQIYIKDKKWRKTTLNTKRLRDKLKIL